MAQTFSEMKNEAGRLLGRSDPAMLTLYGDSINRRYREVMTKHSWPETDTDISVSVAATENSVGIPIEAGLVRSVYNVTHDRFMERIDPVEMDQRFGSEVDDSGVLSHYAVHGNRGAFKNLLDGAMVIYSSNAADSASVRVRGFDGANFPFDLSGTINGTSEVTLTDASMTVEDSRVMEFTKGEDTAGNIFLKSNGTVVSQIGPNERAARYTWLRFLSSASEATTLRVNLKIYPTEFDDDNDVPVLRGIEHILVIGATADGYRKVQQFQKAMAEEARYRDLLEDFMEMHIAETDTAIQASGSMSQYRTM